MHCFTSKNILSVLDFLNRPKFHVPTAGATMGSMRGWVLQRTLRHKKNPFLSPFGSGGKILAEK
jgi:hypothetical protein